MISVEADKISWEVEQAVDQGVFPGAVLLCAKNRQIVFHQSYGLADIFEKKKMDKDAVFDLASLTKPMATALAISKLVEQDRLFLSQSLESVIEKFQTSDKKNITVDMLLRHTSGLPAHREYYRKIIIQDKNSKHCLRELLIQEPLEFQPGEQQVYSDIGYMILSWIVEKITHQRLDHFISEQVYRPLDIKDLFFIDLLSHNNQLKLYQRKIVPAQDCPWRKKVLKGEVDDDNAWAVGGIEGHAGLFGSAPAVHTLCSEILNALQGNPTKVLSAEIIRSFAQKKNGFEMVAGFDTPARENASCGRYFSRRSIGHLGFTGTSFWIDPKTSLIVILLTNRVHPSRSNEGIKAFRRQIHDVIYKALV